MVVCSSISCSRREGAFTTANAEPAPVSISNPRSAPFALVELFTSEGCSSCPPADKNLARITEKAERDGRRVFTLSFHVDYWNYLGWSDPFSARAFSQRQQAHGRALGASTYTPQMVVNGRVELLGSDTTDADGAIEKALTRAASSELVLEPNWNADSRKLTVKWRVDPVPDHAHLDFAVVQGAENIHVTRGENRGETLAHRNVVRAFESVPISNASGSWTRELGPEVAPERAELVGFVEDERSLEVVAAERAKLSS